MDAANEIAKTALEKLRDFGISDSPHANQHIRSEKLRMLDPEAMKLLLTDSISPLPLHKTLELLDVLNERAPKRFLPHLRLALAKSVVFKISNLHFGPEVGVHPPKPDSAVIAPWIESVQQM